VQPAPYWPAPRLWDGQTVAILAGGPSLTHEQVESVRRAAHVRVIAINDSYQLAPWADLFWFCDLRWWSWHIDRAAWRDVLDRADAGDAIVATLENRELHEKFPYVRHLRNSGRDGIEPARDAIRHGSNGGYQALMMAMKLGAARVLLLGYDLRLADDGRTHWHAGHPIVSPATVYSNLMVPAYERAAPEIARAGVRVVNCTPGSALKAFPTQSIEEALRHDASPGAGPGTAAVPA